MLGCTSEGQQVERSGMYCSHLWYGLTKAASVGLFSGGRGGGVWVEVVQQAHQQDRGHLAQHLCRHCHQACQEAPS